MKIICLDVGEKRIGVARADSATRIALPSGYIEVDGTEWAEITKLARLYNTKSFVLGLPRNNDGLETKQSLYVRNFAKKLLEAIPDAKIRFQDESLTSVVAEERLKERGKPYKKGDIDSEAAAVILQDFMENFHNTNSIGAPLDSGDVNKVKLEAKKAKSKVKHKMKKSTKWISIVAIVVALGLIVAGVLLFIRDQRYKEYAEYFRQQESQMQAEVFSFTILPGETVNDVKKKLINVGYSADEVDAALSYNYDFDFLRERPEGASLDGFLYGETHEFYQTDTAQDVIRTFLESMEKVISENNLKSRYEEHGLSLFQGITLASVVQKEANSGDMPTVAQVFLSRLEYGIPLGSDVTVGYALDQVDPNRQIYVDNQSALQVDSCYNTRIYGGLPCGPISNPGLSALLAVAEPSDTTYLYFLTGDDGLMYYSYTEAEHNQNIYSHCQELCNVSL